MRDYAREPVELHDAHVKARNLKIFEAHREPQAAIHGGVDALHHDGDGQGAHDTERQAIQAEGNGEAAPLWTDGERAAYGAGLIAASEAKARAAGDENEVRTLRVLRVDELLTLDIQEREQILSPWLLTQSQNLIHSWRGVGKTHVSLGIGYAVATGGEFLAWKALRPRKVLYIDGEMPASAIKARLTALVEQDERDFDPAMLLTLTPDVQDGPMPDLATKEGQLEIERILGDTELIIVDNISTLVRSGAAENDAESWRSVGDWALSQRRAGRSVLFDHHSAKTGQQRGSSKREDTLDVVIKLERPSDYMPEQGARFEIHFEKYRNSSGEEVKAIEAHLVPGPHGGQIWTWRSVEDSTFDRVVALAAEGLTGKDIAEELGLHKSNVSRHLKKARHLSLVPALGKTPPEANQ